MSTQQSTDQPTPTHSLEEARRRVERSWYFYDGCVDRDEVEAAVKAFARAEVIREVEAVEGSLRESARRLSRFSNSYMDGESAGLIAAADALRALSQGGEGKA